MWLIKRTCVFRKTIKSIRRQDKAAEGSLVKKKKSRRLSLKEKYPPSASCSCEICRSYCLRPGWWTVEEASHAIDSGFSDRMMLEMAPDFSFGVLSPAFRGCERDFALQEFSKKGCNFFSNGLCELYADGLTPLECRFCHHERQGMGIKCHFDIEADWRTPKGRRLVSKWIDMVGLWEKYPQYRLL